MFILPRARCAVLLFALILTLPAPLAQAQAVPEGACELEDGKWCWPVRPVLYGEACVCLTEEGEKYGTGR